MKNMRVLIDTNIILDWLAKREPYYEQAKAVMEASILAILKAIWHRTH